MKLSPNEIRARAAKFATDWADAQYERQDTQTFYNEFFEVFGVQRRKVATFEEPVKKLGDKQGFIDLFWKGKLLVEQKSAGRSLVRARQQALEYFPKLRDDELPRYILLCDFQTFELIDLDTRDEVSFRLAELPDYVSAFDFIRGIEKRVFKDQDPVNIIAAELMGKLHDALKVSGYDGHALERFLVRLLFCLFADDTGIFDELGMLEDFVRNRTREDGSDLGPFLAQLFQVLDTPENQREARLDDDLKRFPYINGQLFGETLRIPAFDKKMRNILLEACGFSWQKISPAIFGALFQSVMNKKERRQKGAHYTTEKNILKVIEPLFLDDLRAELARIIGLKRGRDAALREYQDKLTRLKFFDPACGCGNFLIIAYRELRLLENLVLKALYSDVFNREGLSRSEFTFDVASLSKVNVDQFYGIEIDEFPALIAETAMWMMDHIMNNRLSQEFGKAFARIPLKTAPHIVQGDSLEIDWQMILSSQECSYVLGNPPFIGAKVQSEKQRAQVRRIAALGKSGGTLDYVAAWFLKAGEYIRGSHARIGFVSTNSITQGEQVAQLWPTLFRKYGLEIAFAHRTFAWGSDARGKAQVHVVVLGLVPKAAEPSSKRLFSYDDLKGPPTESRHTALSPYLFDASGLSDRHLVVRETALSISGAPKVIIGTKPIDGGYLILDDEEAANLRQIEPEITELLRPFLGGTEFINGRGRWLVVCDGIPPERLRSSPFISKRLDLVRRYRLGQIPARKKQDQEPKKMGISASVLASSPARFHVTVLPSTSFLALPENSSERREYIPIGWLSPPIVPSNKLRIVTNSQPWQFAILTSRMHVAWSRFIGGKIKSDFQYSISINYNTFPWPKLTKNDETRLDTLGRAILEVRTSYSASTLSDLYDPNFMPSNLRRLHYALDLAVDRLYRKAPFTTDRERVEHLFMLYEKMTRGLLASRAKVKKKKVKAA